MTTDAVRPQDVQKSHEGVVVAIHPPTLTTAQSRGQSGDGGTMTTQIIHDGSGMVSIRAEYDGVIVVFRADGRQLAAFPLLIDRYLELARDALVALAAGNRLRHETAARIRESPPAWWADDEA